MSKLKRSIFEGAATALVTPFKNGAIDFESFGKLIDAQIAGGIDALVVAGTSAISAHSIHIEPKTLISALRRPAADSRRFALSELLQTSSARVAI